MSTMASSRKRALAAIAAVLAGPALVSSQSVFSIDSADTIKKSASILAWDMLQYYKGNQSGQVPGILPGPPPAGDYYWWEGGAMWGTLIDYWYLTGDATYNDLVTQALLFQTGPDHNYMPPNYTASLGNDDQGFWGMSAMSAAEANFPDPPPDQPQWLALAQAVFNTQASPDRHDDSCGGGLRWQIPFSNIGYNYKNSISNGCFFNLGARLARYTKNQTYADWADKTWDWMQAVGFMGSDNDALYDGAHVETNCTDINKVEFSYNNAVFTLGAAHMWNYTSDQIWQDRLNKLVQHGLSTFFANDVAIEPSCEDYNTCTTDMLSFKGYMARWYSTVTRLAPFTADTILPVLKTSAQAAINQCTGGTDGRQCGFRWASGKFDDNTGAGQTMNVLGAVSSLLIDNRSGPVGTDTGGTSKGDPNAGSGSGDVNNQHMAPITTGDRAGAAIITVLLLGSACGMFGWMSYGKG